MDKVEIINNTYKSETNRENNSSELEHIGCILDRLFVSYKDERKSICSKGNQNGTK